MVWRTAHRLHEALAGGVVVRWDMRWPALATTDQTGATTLEVVSRGKHILQRLDSGLTLHSHLRMEGQWRIERPDERRSAARRPDARAVVGTDRWTAVGLRLGMLDLVSTAEERRLVGHLGPDLLGPDWDADLAVANLQRSGLPVAVALLDQRNLAGIGTMWASEALFLERVHPWSRTDELDEERLQQVVARAHRLLDVARRGSVPSSTGSARPGANTYAHGRSGRPCRRCGTTMRVAASEAGPRSRTIFYCPQCQGGLAPSDDGRPQAPLGAVRAPGR
jgi:endonuclease-8